MLAGLAGKQVMVGCIDLADPAVESAATIVERIERALPYVKPENVILAPDCGMKYLPRERAVGKLRAMVEAAKILRQRHWQAVSTSTGLPSACRNKPLDSRDESG